MPDQKPRAAKHPPVRKVAPGSGLVGQAVREDRQAGGPRVPTERPTGEQLHNRQKKPASESASPGPSARRSPKWAARATITAAPATSGAPNPRPRPGFRLRCGSQKSRCFSCIPGQVGARSTCSRSPPHNRKDPRSTRPPAKYQEKGMVGAANTQRAYKSDLRGYERFCIEQGHPTFSGQRAGAGRLRSPPRRWRSQASHHSAPPSRPCARCTTC